MQEEISGKSKKIRMGTKLKTGGETDKKRAESDDSAREKGMRKAAYRAALAASTSLVKAAGSL